MISPAPISTPDRLTLARLGWTLGTTYATRMQKDRFGRQGIARLTLTACGAWMDAET